ncbi:uncharacterized protein [Prorops nasuta]|uniref:uncharacterized protein n=1 Tax=Prorops nasuta TaxID=863751 RepID=UPI0034CD98D8
MSAAVREINTTQSSKKIMTHSGPISSPSHSTFMASSLENNLDALLEDLQTSVSRETTQSSSNKGGFTSQYEYRTANNPTRIITETRTLPATKSSATTTEKYVSSGPIGTPTGIPGLEFIEKELQDVQPGQTKTVAYKQMSYQYDTNAGSKSPDRITTNRTIDDMTVVDDFHEKTYNERKLGQLHRSPVSVTNQKKIDKEIVADYSSCQKRISPVSDIHQRDVKYIREATSYQNEHSQEPDYSSGYKYDNTSEYIPRLPTSSIPPHLSPGPNTKVTTTVKTYTYELPSSPEHYLSSSETSNVLPAKYGTSQPQVDVTKTTRTMHKERKFYCEEQGEAPVGPYSRSSPITESRNTVTKYYEQHGSKDQSDYPRDTGFIYQRENQSPTLNETRTTINRVEEHYPATQSREAIYKYSSTTTNIPPGRNAEDHECLLPGPFPTSTPVKSSPSNQQPPKKLEDLMASFSSTESRTLEEIDRPLIYSSSKSSAIKKEVDFIPHTPPMVKTKNIAGPPVYYPPGSAEFTKKEESGAAMSQSGGAWQKASGKYEYEASSKSKSKSSSGAAVVPVCLPLCCALPCVIM